MNFSLADFRPETFVALYKIVVFSFLIVMFLLGIISQFIGKRNENKYKI